MSPSSFSSLWYSTAMVLMSCAVSSHGRVGGRKTTQQHLAAINAHYTDPGTPLETSQRGMCRGFKQTETLKGTWEPHPDPSYRGLTSIPKCPAFARDFDCNGDWIDAQYHPLAAQEFNQVFRPYGCELHPVNAQHFAQCLQGRRIIMIGDSTMRQMFQSLACLLGDHIQDGFMQHWNQANESHIHIPFEREYMIDETLGHHVYKQFVGGFLLQNRVPVYLRSFGVLNLTLWDDVMGEFMPLTSNDIIIAEFGAWYPRFDDELAAKSWKRFTADMRLLFGARLREVPGTVLWRSYAPSHFGGELGTYQTTAEHFGILDIDVCQPASKGEYFLDTEIIHYLQNECGSACSHIHVLPIFHLSLQRTHSHHGSFGSGVKESRIDCRHYCTNVVDVWNQVLYNKLCFS